MNNKQTVFVAEYMKDFNASRAARAAGYSAKTARVIGSENLTKPDIAEAIKAEIQEKVMGKDEVKLRIADIARGDMADLMQITPSGFTLELITKDNDGNLTPNPRTKLIKKIKQKVTTFLAKKESDEDREIIETELELYSAHEALRDIARMHGLMKDNLDVNVRKVIDVTIDPPG